MAANVPDPTRILSIQSHVVSGYVGNRSATFPLQLLGWDVDVANTVQFSNHTGYGRWGGVRFDASHLDELFQGLDRNGLLRYSRMLTGYMPSAAVVGSVLELVKKLRARRAAQSEGGDRQEDGASAAESGGLVYLLDPVMGDMGRGMYVAPEVLPMYKQMLPYSTIITPNQFEAQALTDLQITDLDSLRQVIWSLHRDHRVPHVIITSIELPPQELHRIGATATLDNGQTAMLQVGSSYNPTAPPKDRNELDIWMIQFPEVDGYFSGVGDLFAALTLGRFEPEGSASGKSDPNASNLNGERSLTPIARASELAIASLQGILANTSKVIDRLEKEEAANPPPATKTAEQEDPAETRVRMMRKRELRIIQSREEIERPQVVYRARWIS